MEMKIVNGEVRVDTETDEESEQVNALVSTRVAAPTEALLADLLPVFERHGVDINDLEKVTGEDFRDVIRLLVQEKLWSPAAAELFLGGRF
jgi:hypothetical protein